MTGGGRRLNPDERHLSLFIVYCSFFIGNVLRTIVVAEREIEPMTNEK
jgi:hypothetical protein